MPKAFFWWMTAHAVTDTALGVALLLLPAQSLVLGGWLPGYAPVARVVGAALIGYAALSWLARTAMPDGARIALHALLAWNICLIGVLSYLALTGMKAAAMPLLSVLPFAAAFAWYARRA